MYPTPNPVYGITPAPQPAVVVPFGWSRVPADLVRLGPLMIAGAVGAFIGRAVLSRVGVPWWLSMLAGGFGLGGLILALYRRVYGATVGKAR